MTAKKWYGFAETDAEGESLDAVQLTEEEFAIVKKVFNERETFTMRHIQEPIRYLVLRTVMTQNWIL